MPIEQLLTTKLFIPKVRSELVQRPRLFEKLNTGLQRKLTLVTAPAGFGKTTLVCEWIANGAHLDQPLRAGWLSLDEEDSDLNRFLTYFIAALQKISPRTGDDILASIQSPQPPPVEIVLTALLNEIALMPDPFILVLDDYHLLESSQVNRAMSVDQALTFLLKHLPPPMHLVILSREDPNLPLARLRARGDLIELRVTDLHFTLSEAAAFFHQAMGLSLSDEDINALEARTEGWIAGLQLAALALQGISMQGQKEISSFVQSFTGSHHFVVDYLVEEVLEQQPKEIQTFLLCTSILDRMCGPLCDAVCSGETAAQQDQAASMPAIGGQETLQYLEQANLFLVPLDNERYWYRYHHLFADLLRKRLQQMTQQPGQSGTTLPNGTYVKDLAEYHHRASVWYEEQGLTVEAFHHAAAANDIDRAEYLIAGEGLPDKKGMPLLFRGVLTPVLNWFETLPGETLDARPSLWITYITALTMAGKPVHTIEEKLQAAEAGLQRAVSDEKTRDLLGQVAANRAMLAVPQNDVDALFTQSHRALEYLHPDNLPVRTSATWTLGYAYQLQGNREAASQTYQEVLSTSQASGNIMMKLAAATCLGQVQESDNQLHRAAETYHNILHMAGDPELPGACEAHLGLARIAYQWNDLPSAQRHAQKSLQLAKQLDNVNTPALSMLILGDVSLAKGDPEGAAKLFTEVEQFLRRRPSTDRTNDITAAMVRSLLFRGEIQAAAELAARHKDPLSQARVFLAQGNSAQALVLLETLRKETENRDWKDKQLEVMVLQAVALQAQGDQPQASQMLRDALALAEPGGFMRIFLDAGPQLAELLQAVTRQGTTSEITRQILAAFGETKTPPPASQPVKVAAGQPQASGLLEPLSERERDVLRLLRSYLTGPEIAQELMVSLNTMRTHTKNIYSKLGVNTRQDAVRKAEELGLL